MPLVPPRARRVGRLAVPALVVLGLGLPAVAGSATARSPLPTYLSCRDLTQDLTVNDQRTAAFVFRAHPRSCAYARGGAATNVGFLSGLRWRGWGAPTASATGSVKLRGAGGRRPVRVSVTRLVTTQFHQRFYTRLRVVTAGGVHVYRLRLPTGLLG